MSLMMVREWQFDESIAHRWHIALADRRRKVVLPPMRDPW